MKFENIRTKHIISNIYLKEIEINSKKKNLLQLQELADESNNICVEDIQVTTTRGIRERAAWPEEVHCRGRYEEKPMWTEPPFVADMYEGTFLEY